MVAFYAMKIVAGKLTVNEVPARWRNEVIKKLEG